MNVPEDFILDYLRGIIDGDGCIYIGRNGPKGCKYKRFNLSVCSASYNFLNKIQKYFNCGRIIKIKKYFVWKTENSREIYNILSKLYNGNFCLQRKYFKFLELSEYLNRKML